MSRIQTLVATMNQVDHSLVEEMNIQTDAIIANQSNEFSHQRFNHAGNTIDFYSFSERGVGLNRNNAFMRATAEICLLADDDIQYYHGYPSLIAKQFDERPDADVVIFNLDEESGTRFQITEPVRVGFTNFMRFGAPRVAFRRKSVFLQGVLFNLSFGGGTEISAGEDARPTVGTTGLDPHGPPPNPSCHDLHVVYLGTDLGRFDELARSGPHPIKPSSERWIAYIGTLGHSYDLVTVIDAVRLARDQGADDLRLIVMGDGPLRNKFERHAKEKEVPADFLGRLDYGSMVRRLLMCDFAVNPIVAQAAGSVINKVADYAAAGLPVLNTQECAEYRDLLESYRAGLNCNNEDARDLSENLLLLHRDDQLREELGANNRRLAEEQFDRARTYLELMTLFGTPA